MLQPTLDFETKETLPEVAHSHIHPTCNTPGINTIQTCTTQYYLLSKWHSEGEKLSAEDPPGHFRLAFSEHSK